MRRFIPLILVSYLSQDALAWAREMMARNEIRSRVVPPSNHPDGPDIYKVIFHFTDEKIPLKVKISKVDPWNSLYTFRGEQGIRKLYFYPYLPCVFLDVGCNLGSWTLPALAKGSPVYGFEPDERYLDDLIETIKINNFNHAFHGICAFVFNKSNVLVNAGEIENVWSISIDDFVESFNIGPEYIKIDVEGFEQRVIDGAMNTFKKYKPKVLVENHDWVSKTMGTQIREKMEDVGYQYIHAGRLSDDVSYSFFR